MPARVRPTTAVLIALALILLGIQWLLPQGAFWITDCSNKYLTVVNLARKGFTDFAIEYPGRADDPGLAVSPIAPPFGEFREGRLVSAYPPLFPFLAAFPYALLGFPGLWLWPLLGSLLIVYALMRMGAACRLSPRAQVACGLTALLCTPLLFYTFCFWELTLATGIALLGLLLLAGHLTTPAPRRVFIAGAVFGLALGLREEFVLLAVAVLLGLLIERRTRTRAAWLFPAGVLAGYVPIALFQTWAIGSPFGFHVATNVTTSGITRAVDPAALLAERWLVTRKLLANVSTSGAFTFGYVGAFLALAAMALRIRRPRPGHVLSICGGALVLTVAGAAVLFLAADRIWAWMQGNGLLMHAALLIPALFLAPYAGDEPPARIARLLRNTALLFVLLLCLTAPPVSAQGMHWGPRLMLPVYPLLFVPLFMFLCRTPLAASGAESGSLPPVASTAAGDRSGTAVPAAHGRWPAVRMVCGALLVVSLIVQGLSVRVLGQKLTTTREIEDRIAAMPHAVVVSNIWWFPQEMAPIFYQKEFFYARDNESLRGLVQTLRARGERQFLYVTAVDPKQTPVYRSHSPLEFLDVDVIVYGIK